MSETVPCRHCGVPTPMLGTKACDRCYELASRIERDPEMALKMLPPIDMVLHCPACGLQHIDRAEEPRTLDPECVWANPPHRSHFCARCRHIWRPADVPTNGVEAVKTKGKNDSEIAS